MMGYRTGVSEMQSFSKQCEMGCEKKFERMLRYFDS